MRARCPSTNKLDQIGRLTLDPLKRSSNFLRQVRTRLSAAELRGLDMTIGNFDLRQRHDTTVQIQSIKSYDFHLDQGFIAHMFLHWEFGWRERHGQKRNKIDSKDRPLTLPKSYCFMQPGKFKRFGPLVVAFRGDTYWKGRKIHESHFCGAFIASGPTATRKLRKQNLNRPS